MYSDYSARIQVDLLPWRRWRVGETGRPLIAGRHEEEKEGGELRGVMCILPALG